MRKALREVLRTIRSRGGEDIAIREGGQHTIVHYTVAGQRRRAVLHKGSIDKRWREAQIRDQIMKR